ncbi:hypothetical protein [Flavobacterium difficile]|uniref:Uncharacterized protein n=1 Tax=Flavobacterium difficile TaxID=2709659 RepID=A0ABX0I6N0_9FLAO|nr:hypothetical protein [Flavobacterium difficile]NHM02584.1 hypothetical protein [Flavobacterium difficile]
MKNLVALLFFGLFAHLGFSQTYQFKAVNFSVSQKTDKGTWSKWSKTQPTELLINLDRDKHRFVVHSQIIQLYNIVKYEDKVVNETGTSNRYFCIDNVGLETVITIVSPKDAGSSKQIYIANEEMIIEYDLIYLGEKK